MIVNAVNTISLLLFFGTIPIMITILGKFNFACDYLASQFHDDTKETYDFIVVGAGSAGAVIANRLSKNNKVLLIEAGGYPLPYNNIPLLAPDLLDKPEVAKMYMTEKQKGTHWAMEDQRSAWPRGKLLGGTSNLNFMVYNRGHPFDYDNWANITGDPSWRYENVLQYFKKSIDYHGDFYKNEKHYGQSPYGYMHVESRAASDKPLYKNFIEAGKELGYDEVDLNGPQQEGFGPIELTQKKGKRHGTFAAFLKDFIGNRNLHVVKYAQATKVKLDENQRAVGVWYIKHGMKFFARAAKEVIVSAGAIDSPKLLILSGIGPKESLQSLGIKHRIDLPVGKNLKDHFAVLMFSFIINETRSMIPERDFGLQTLTDYFIHGRGPLTFTVGLHSQAFITTESAKKSGHNWPNLQLIFMSTGVYENFANDLSSSLKIHKDLLDKYFEPVVGKDAFNFAMVLGSCKSAGELKLSDKNPLSDPIIDPKYLEDPRDLQALIEGFRFVMKLAEETKAFRSIDAHMINKHFPGCEKHELKTDAYYECYIRNLGTTLYHPVGTCAMGRGVDDPKSVVDSKLRVVKTIGLRVADASVMPDITNANTNCPSIMIGEKAADMIREYWSEQFLICNRQQRMFKDLHFKCFYSRLV